MSLPITAIEATDETTPAATDLDLADLKRRIERLEVITGGRSLDVDSRDVLTEMTEFLRWLCRNSAFKRDGDTYKHICYLLEKANATQEGRQARFEGI